MPLTLPYARLMEACRRGESLRGRAALLRDAASSLLVVFAFGFTVAWALPGGALARASAVSALVSSASLAILARRTRRLAEAQERDLGQLLAGPGRHPAPVHRPPRVRLATSRPTEARTGLGGSSAPRQRCREPGSWLRAGQQEEPPWALRAEAAVTRLASVLVTTSLLSLLVGLPILGFAIERRTSVGLYAAAVGLLVVAAASIALAALGVGPHRNSRPRGLAHPEADRAPSGPSRSLEAERAASRDLLEIDRFVRRLYAALTGAGLGSDAVRGMLADGARFDVAGAGWWQRASTLTPDTEVTRGEPAVRFRERSRTVHLLADVAIVISTCEFDGGGDRSTAVSALQLQRSSSGWLLRELLARSRVLPVSERTADPRPLADRAGTDRPPGRQMWS